LPLFLTNPNCKKQQIRASPDAEQLYFDATFVETAEGKIPHRQLGARAIRSKPSIVVVGDGLTEGGFSYKLGGWGAQLTGAYLRKVGGSVVFAQWLVGFCRQLGAVMAAAEL